MMKNKGAYIIAFAAFLWSLDSLLRASLYSLPPAVIVFWEHVLGAIILSPLLFIKFDEIKKMTRKEWIAILLVSCFSGALGTILYTAALGKINYIQFSVVPLLQQLQPVWGISMAGLVLKEKINKQFIVWALLAIGASYLVTFKDLTINFNKDSQTIMAALFAFGAGFVWATSTSLSKIVLHKVSFATATLLRFIFAPVFALLFIVILKQQSQIFLINTDQWLRLLAITFSTGMVSLGIYYYGLKNTPARVSAIAELTWPVSAILIGYFYFNQILSVTQTIGAVVLLYSIYKVSSFKK